MKKREQIEQLEQENALLRRHIKATQKAAGLGGIMLVPDTTDDDVIRRIERINWDRKQASPTHPNCMIGRKS